MRGIQFRGKSVDTGKWTYGYLIGDNVIVGNIVEFNDEYFNTSFWQKVRPETVGQDTGLKDKNGKEVYEGCNLHVLEVSNERTLDYVSRVEYIESGFLVTQPDGCQVPLACFHNLDNTYPLFEIEVTDL